MLEKVGIVLTAIGIFCLLNGFLILIFDSVR